jgi:plastocyanin
MLRYAVPLLLAVSACSSGSGTTSLGSPSPVLSTSPTPGAAVTTAATTATPTLSPTPSLSPSPRRTASPSPSATPSRTSSPKPSASASSTRSPKTYGIDQVTGDQFSPTSVSLRVGDSVLVTDTDAVAPHTFTITSLGVASGAMSQGDTFRYRFMRAGTFTYVCDYHKNPPTNMKGTVTVTR